MILLDTNVVSEAMRTAPDANVIDWLNQCNAAELYVSSVTVAEIAYGIHTLDAGRRRNTLGDRFKTFLDRGFHSRILPFDEPAAHLYGELMSHRRAIGKPMGIADGQIAAIARHHDMHIATRDVRGFQETGLELINPWAQP